MTKDQEKIVHDLRYPQSLYQTYERKQTEQIAANMIESDAEALDIAKIKIEWYRRELNRVKQEKEAAIEQLRGKCWCCKKGKPWPHADSKLRTCAEMEKRGVAGIVSDCESWEWDGGAKDGRPD